MDKPGAGLNQRMFAWAISRFSGRYEQFAGKYKERLFAGLSGTVLEIGPGTGINLRYFRGNDVRWIGVEPNLFMERYLCDEAARLGMTVDLRIGTAEALPFDNESVDAVISTLVLCCVKDQGQSLREAIRVEAGRPIGISRACGGGAGNAATADAEFHHACLEAVGRWVPSESRNRRGIGARRIRVRRL